MLTQEPTPEMIREWQKLYNENRSALTPNRRSGFEVDAYFRAQYAFTETQDAAFAEVIAANITEESYHAAKLPSGAKPDIRTYRVGEVLVGIDLASGYFQVECEDIRRAELIYDDLFVFRGLDATDIENYFLAAQYLSLRRSKGGTPC